MGRAGRSLTLVEGGAKGATLQTGRLGNQFANLAGQIAHVHPVVGNLAGVLGNFAIGATLTVGILAGVAAVATVYDKLTASSRKAMEIGDKLIETYNRAARIKALGGQQLADIEDINKGLEQHHKWLGFIIAARIQLGALGGILGKDPGGHAAQVAAGVAARAAAEQERVNAIGLQNAKDNEAWAARIKDEKEKAAEATKKAAAAAKQAQQDFLAGATSSIAVFDNLAAHGTSSSVVNEKLIADYTKIAAQIRDMGTASGPAVAELLRLRDVLMANLVVAQAVAAANATGTVGPLAGKALPGVGFTPSAPAPGTPMAKVGSPSDPIVEVGDQVQLQLQRDAEKAAQHAQMLQSAILQSAQIISQSVTSALNVGGGGPVSGIGGAVGSVLGAGLTIGAGVLTSGLWGIVGGLAGSLLGGLFDSHKKEVNANTQALRANTAAYLLYAPAGFRAESYRYNASDPRPLDRMGRYIRANASRGGANPLITP